MGTGIRMKPDNHKLYQTMSEPGNIREHKLYVDENWSLYGKPTSWWNSDTNSYFIHRCPKFELPHLHQYWINDISEEGVLCDICCQNCHTSAPYGIQALWRFHNPRLESILVFIEANK